MFPLSGILCLYLFYDKNVGIMKSNHFLSMSCAFRFLILQDEKRAVQPFAIPLSRFPYFLSGFSFMHPELLPAPLPPDQQPDRLPEQ